MSFEALPPGWAPTTLGQITAHKVEQSGPDPGSKHFVYVDIGSIGAAKAIETRQLVPTSEAASRARQRLKTGDVVVSMTRPNLNAVTMVPPDFDGAIGSTGFHVLRAQLVEPGYLFAVVRSPAFVGAMTALVQGALYPAVRPDDVRGFEIPLPPSNEQKRIVAKIEELTARSRRAKEALDAVPPLLDQLRQSILAAAFRGDLTADWRAKNPNVELADKHTARIRAERRDRWEAGELAKLAAKGKRPTDDRWKEKYVEPAAVDEGALPHLPPGWCWVPLPLLGELSRGKSKHRPRNDPALFGSSAPFIQTGEVARSRGRIREYSTMYSDFGVSQSRLFPKGTLCITIAANIADTGILEFDACFPDSVVGFVADGGAKMASYVELFVRTARSDLQRFAPATAQANINLEILGQVAVPIPPEDELQLLVERVEQAMARVERTAEEGESARLRLETLEQGVLAKAFRGELVRQDPNDEPASVLLERIRATRDSAAASGSRRGSRKAEEVAEDQGESDDDDGSDASAPPVRPTPDRRAAKEINELDQDAVHDEVFAALWARGPLEKDDAVRRVAEHLREAGYVEFQRLRSDGPLYAQFLGFIEAAVKTGRLDRPKRGQVRACKADAATFTADDWRHALVASLGTEPVDREEAIRVAAEWARDNLGLEFSRLRADGQIVEGLRSAINSGIRRGEVVRHDAKRISRASGNGSGQAERSGPTAYRVSLSMMDGDFVVHEMGKFFCVDGKIVVPPENSSNWLIAELRDGIVGPGDQRLTFDDGEEFINNIAFAWKKWPRYCSIEPANPDEVARLLGGAVV